MTPFLIDNDNIYLKTIASGEMTGTPEPHMYYMGFLSGAVISFFYRITGNGIPWFGIFLCLSLAIPMILMLHRSLLVCEKVWSAIAVWGLYTICFCNFFYHYFAKTQYTVATGFVGAGALFLLCMLSVKENTRSFFLAAIPFFILSVCSFGMRDKGFLMLFPFLGMVFLEKLLEGEKRSQRRNVIGLGCLFLAVLLLPWAWNRAQYSSKAWKEFKAYTDASEILFDYDGFPEYDSHQELYSELGILRSSYEAITKHYNILMDPAVNRDTMVRLAEVAEKERLEEQAPFFMKLVQVLRDIVDVNLKQYQDRPLNILVFLLYFFVALLAMMGKKLGALREILFVVVARMFDWIYLVWYGRYPFRVTQIIYMAELVMLVSILLKHKLWSIGKEKSKPGLAVFGTMCVLILLSGIRFGFPVMKGNYQHVKGIRELSVCFPELEEYLTSKRENFYYFDMSHLYYMEDTLKFQSSPYENYVYMGSWMPNSPWYREKMEHFGITDVAEALLTNEHVFILYQQVDFDTRDFLDDYFDEHYPGTELKVVDEFASSNGFHYEVLKPMRKSIKD